MDRRIWRGSDVGKEAHAAGRYPQTGPDTDCTWSILDRLDFPSLSCTSVTLSPLRSHRSRAQTCPPADLDYQQPLQQGQRGHRRQRRNLHHRRRRHHGRLDLIPHRWTICANTTVWLSGTDHSQFGRWGQNLPAPIACKRRLFSEAHSSVRKRTGWDNIIIPEQFTVKAHPTLFEGRGPEPENEALLFQSTVDINFQNANKTLFQSTVTVDIHFQNVHKTHKTAKARTLCVYFKWKYAV